MVLAGLINVAACAQITLALGGLAGQQVPSIGLTPLNSTAPGDLKTLPRTFACL